MHERKVDPSIIVHDWLSEFLEELAGLEVGDYEFLDPKSLDFFLKQGYLRRGLQDELSGPLLTEDGSHKLGLLHGLDDLSEAEDATLSVLADPDLEEEAETGADFYNFFFLKTREIKKSVPRVGGLFFFDQAFFFCEEEPIAGALGLLVNGQDPLGVDEGFYAEDLDSLDHQEFLEPSLYEDLEEASIEALFFGTSALGGALGGQKQALLETYFVDELSEAPDGGRVEDEEVEEGVEDPIDALVLEGALLEPYGDEETSSSDDEEAPLFEKNFLPFFFVLKRLRSFFFFKNIFSFFFFFFPLELFNFVYSSLEEDFESSEMSENFFFETLRGPKIARELNKTPVSLVEAIQSYIYEPSKQGKHKSFFFFLFLSRFFNQKLREDFCLSVISSRALRKDFSIFVLKYSGIIKPFFEHMMFSFNTPEFIEVLFLCLKVKDLSALATYVKILFERIQIKFHKVFLRKLDLFLTFFFNKLRSKFGVKGFFLDVRGKVSVVGNSKKRHVCIKKGYLSKTKKELRFFFMKNQINTTTGVLGASYLLSY